jgi:hypothetical protein
MRLTRLPNSAIKVIATLIFCLATNGCAPNANLEPAPAELVRVDLAPRRCPPLDRADTAPFGERVAAPSGGVSLADMRSWIDAQDALIERQSRAGRRVARQYEQCRGGGGR